MAVQVAAVLVLALIAIRFLGGPILRGSGALLLLAGLIGLALGQSTSGALVVIAAGVLAWSIGALLRRRTTHHSADSAAAR